MRASVGRAALLSGLLLGLFLPGKPAAAQESGGVEWFDITGRFTAYGELYGRSGIGEGLRPAQTGRLNGQLTVSLANGAVVMPVTMILATDQVAFRQSINQIGVSPTWRWATVYAGHFSPEYSPYSLQDATLLGGGAEVNTGIVRAGAVTGRARAAVAPVPGQQVVPEYSRSMQAARLGLGRAEAAHVDVFFLNALDDPASLDTAMLSTPLTPEANVVTAIQGAVPVSGLVDLEARLAFSSFEPDRRADADPIHGTAGSVAVAYTREDWSAGLEVEQVGGGFHNAGNTGLKNDRRDIRLRGRGRFWERRVALNGSIGLRRDNLSDALEATKERTIANLTGTVQPWPSFGVDFQVANDRQQATARIRSRSQKTVTGNYTVTPRVVFRTGAVQHVVFGFLGFQSAVNTSPDTVAPTVDTRARTALASWSVALASGLTLSANATAVRTRFQQDTTRVTTTITTLAPGAAYTTLQGRLQASLQLQHTRTRLQNPFLPAPTTTAELFPAIEVRYDLGDGQSLTLQSSYRRYDMTDGATLPGDPTGAGSFTERRVSLAYTRTFR